MKTLVCILFASLLAIPVMAYGQEAEQQGEQEEVEHYTNSDEGADVQGDEQYQEDEQYEEDEAESEESAE